MFSLLFDDRKAPELLTSNALITTGATSLTQLLDGPPPLSETQIRDLAKAITATSKQFSLSVTRPFGSNGRHRSTGGLPTSERCPS